MDKDKARQTAAVRAGVDSDSIARRALAAMEELDQARVSTIHGLCSEILREFPVQAGIDPDFAVDSGYTMGRMLKGVPGS